ncbi:MAG: tetratricopeptide repeat protein [Geobacteraceae bacterium]
MHIRLRSKNYLILPAIALIGLLAYCNTFSVPFQFDDDAYVVNNPAIRDFGSFLSPGEITGGTTLSPTGIPPALRFAFMTRIAGYLSLAVNYRLHGLDVTGYHLVNLLLHILNAWLFYLILTHTFGSRSNSGAGKEEGCSGIVPLFAALLFLCHPIQTHAVTYVTSRFVLLASFFSLLSLASYIRFRTASARPGRTAFLGLSVISAGLGMMTKEFTFTLPFLIALYEFSFFRGGLREHLRSVAPLALTLPIIPLLIFFQQGSITALDSTMRTITAADSSRISRLDYLLTQLTVIVQYLKLLVFPAGQNVDHDFPVQHSLLSPAVAGSFLLLLALLSWAVFSYYRSLRTGEGPATRIIPFGIFWFFIALSVESSIIPLGEISAEYRLYLPSAGMIVAFTALAIAAAGRFSLNRTLCYCAALLLIMALCAATLLRNRVWQSEISLWRDAAMKSPAKVRPHQNLALYYGMQGRSDEARQELEKAISIEPRNFELHNNLGIIYRQQGDLDKAIREYQLVLQLEPADAMARYNLGNVYLGQGRYRDALREYRKCLELIPEYDELHNNLGIVYWKTGQIGEAVREFEQALRLNPQNLNARNNLESSKMKAGNNL